MHYWIHEGKIYAQLPNKGSRHGGFPKEIGTVKENTLYVQRSPIHTYIHKAGDLAPGKESISFAKDIVHTLAAAHWGFTIINMNVKTKKNGLVKGEITVEVLNKIAHERKHPSGYFETQLDVLVEDLLKELK